MYLYFWFLAGARGDRVGHGRVRGFKYGCLAVSSIISRRNLSLRIYFYISKIRFELQHVERADEDGMERVFRLIVGVVKDGRN